MSLFAIGDLHLSGFKPKPMDIFGENWQQHQKR
jgi:Predicted phosphohydrolase